jgi:hypothetical protein
MSSLRTDLRLGNAIADGHCVPETARLKTARLKTAKLTSASGRPEAGSSESAGQARLHSQSAGE